MFSVRIQHSRVAQLCQNATIHVHLHSLQDTHFRAVQRFCTRGSDHSSGLDGDSTEMPKLGLAPEFYQDLNSDAS